MTAKRKRRFDAGDALRRLTDLYSRLFPLGKDRKLTQSGLKKGPETIIRTVI